MVTSQYMMQLPTATSTQVSHTSNGCGLSAVPSTLNLIKTCAYVLQAGNV